MIRLLRKRGNTIFLRSRIPSKERLLAALVFVDEKYLSIETKSISEVQGKLQDAALTKEGGLTYTRGTLRLDKCFY